jgi:hypothetical protein
LVANIRERKKVSNGGRPRSREASAVQRATLPVRRLIENLYNRKPKATAMEHHVPNES